MDEKVLELLLNNTSGLTTEQIHSSLDISSEELTSCLNTLGTSHKVEFLQLPGQNLVFKARDPNLANLFSQLNDHDRIVYQFIKDSGNKGTWLKHIKDKSGLHTKNVTDSIKSLEKLKLVKLIKSVKQPTKKVYMLYEIEPSVELTGGSWYTDDQMDVEFINTLCNLMVRFIRKTKPQNGIHKFGYDQYKTTKQIHEWVQQSGLTTQKLSLQDIQQLLNRLVYDGYLQEHEHSDEYDYEQYCYEALAQEELQSAFVESCCGQCPVRSFCQVGGPVSPETCVYLKEWLSF